MHIELGKTKGFDLIKRNSTKFEIISDHCLQRQRSIVPDPPQLFLGTGFLGCFRGYTEMLRKLCETVIHGNGKIASRRSVS